MSEHLVLAKDEVIAYNIYIRIRKTLFFVAKQDGFDSRTASEEVVCRCLAGRPLLEVQAWQLEPRSTSVTETIPGVE